MTVAVTWLHVRNFSVTLLKAVTTLLFSFLYLDNSLEKSSIFQSQNLPITWDRYFAHKILFYPFHLTCWCHLCKNLDFSCNWYFNQYLLYHTWLFITIKIHKKNNIDVHRLKIYIFINSLIMVCFMDYRYLSC